MSNISDDINTAINIQVSLIMSFKGILVTALITNSSIPNGGVISPIIVLITAITKKKKK